MPLVYANRHGDTYYLHGRMTKKGNPCYFVSKSPNPSALASMPEGYEFSESVNGVVSVRRKSQTPDLVPEADVEAVRRELVRHSHLRYHIVEKRKDEIIIHEPQGALTNEEIQYLRELFGWRNPSIVETAAELQKKLRYIPIMKFTALSGALPRQYIAYRRSFRGERGWHRLTMGVLEKLLLCISRQLVPI